MLYSIFVGVSASDSFRAFDVADFGGTETPKEVS